MKSRGAEIDFVESNFSDIYLTIISLIQGIALTILAENFVEDIKLIGETGLLDSVDIHYLRYLISFTIIFINWQHYVYGVIYLRWFLGTVDTLIPFSLGAFQFVFTGIIREHNQYYWLFFVSLLFLFAGFAYLNAAFKTTPLLFTAHYGKELSRNIVNILRKVT